MKLLGIVVGPSSKVADLSFIWGIQGQVYKLRGHDSAMILGGLSLIYSEVFVFIQTEQEQSSFLIDFTSGDTKIN